MRAPLFLRIALRELRGGLRGFRVFLACLALGVAAIAGVGSLSSALMEGLRQDGQVLLGGDVELRLTHRPATPAQLDYLRGAGRLSAVVEMRAMALTPDRSRRALVELKGVDAGYPLYGAVSLENGGDLREALVPVDGLPGALAEPLLLRRLGLAVGDVLRVGERRYRIAGMIAREPDRGADAFVLGPRLLVDRETLAGTGLIQEGSLIRYRYRVGLPDGAGVAAFLAQLKQDFPDAGWRIRDLRNGAPGLRRFVDRMRLFLTLVGLTALLVGGLGVANAIKAYLDGRTGTIATLKCLGAPAGLVFRAYLAQVMILAGVGVAVGLVVGAVVPPALSGLLQAYLPFTARVGIYPGPLLLATLYGLLTALAFALWPLARAREVPAGALFRDLAAPSRRRPRAGFVLLTAAAIGLLALVAVITADEPMFALWFVLAAAAALLAFAVAGVGVVRLARRLPRPRQPVLRLALANLHRPGAPTVPVVLSFGLGLSVLVAVTTLQGNLSAQVAERLPAEAPAFFFIDIQPHQAEPFQQLAQAMPGVGTVEKVPSLRGRIVRVNGTDADRIQAPANIAWALRGDRGLTYMGAPPPDATIVAGQWWPEDYAGPPLLSLDVEVAQGLGVGIGDSLTINVLGREIEARIANLRQIDWTTLGINFVIVFAPGALEAAPHTFIATAKAQPEAELPLQTAVTDNFANVTAIRVRDALEAVNRILGNIGMAVRATAGVTLAAGVLVLAGAVAAEHRRRVYDSVVLKVLGASRRRIMATHLAEYAVTGLVVSLLALLVGTAAAYVVVTQVMDAPWLWLPGTALATAALSLAITLGLGLLATWAALSQRPAPLLRNE